MAALQTDPQLRVCLEQLKALTNHNHVALTNCGNSAIFLALNIVKNIHPKPYLLIPDQGGWLSYETYPLLLGFQIKKVKTDRCLIDLDDLKTKLENHDAAALLVASNAGYCALQDMQAIANICKSADCLLIDDASGSLGMRFLLGNNDASSVCDGNLADIIVGSFGRWKIVDVGHGGFISCKEDWLKEDHAPYPPLSFTKHRIDLNILHQKLENIKKRLQFLMTSADRVKSELQQSGFSVVHPHKKGLNVIAAFHDEHEKNKILDWCKKQTPQSFETTLCPRYIRVMEPAVSIELKRLQEK